MGDEKVKPPKEDIKRGKITSVDGNKKGGFISSLYRFSMEDCCVVTDGELTDIKETERELSYMDEVFYVLDGGNVIKWGFWEW